MNFLSKLTFITSLAACFIITSCGDDETPLPIIGVAFETTALGIASDANSVNVVVSLSRSTTVDSKASISVAETAVQYGTGYTTTPAVSNGAIELDIPSGSETVSFTVTRAASLLAPGSSVAFTLTGLTGETNSEISGNTTVTVSFDAVASAGNSFTAEIGGPTEPNQVFVDLSLDTRTTAERTSWDLGFYSGSENKVIVNYATFALARALDKTDMNSVTAQDTIGFAASVRIGTAGAHAYIDHPDGDLGKLAIADISATDSDNKVYIINRGGGPGTGTVNPGSVDVGSTPRGWKKIRILRSGSNYKIQHADIGATTFEEVTVTKDPNYNFVYFSFDSNTTPTVEPPKAEWDFVFTVSSNIINFGLGDGAYGFSDFALSNRQGGVQVARVELERDGEGNVIAGQTSYDDFTSANLSTVTFSPNGNTIGSSWRSVFSRTAHDYVYFIIKDNEGNNYKVQFLGLMNQQGERGNSSVKYALL